LRRTNSGDRFVFIAPLLRASRLYSPLLFLLFTLIPAVALGQSGQDSGEVCFAVADEFDPDLARDTLTSLQLATGNTQIIDTESPAGTGTDDIEAISFGPGHRLYGADGAQLGILDTATGTFLPFFEPFGAGTGSLGPKPITFGDSDGLAYSLDQNIFFGTDRRFDASNPAPGDPLRPDLLFAIDPATGAHIDDFFGPGVDYVVVQPVNDDNGNPLPDLDDIQFNPVTGELWGVENAGGRDGVLVTIDIATGATTRIATLHYASGEIIDDVEGISFTNDGTLYASTGDNFIDLNDKNRLFRITDPANGLGELVAPFPTGPKDYEGLACLSLEAAIVLKKYTNGPGQAPQDADTPTGPEIDAGATVTWTYIFTNTGVLSLTHLSLIDDHLGAIAPPGSCIPAGTILGPGQSLTCTATGLAQSGQYSNTATISADSVPEPLFPSQPVSDTNPSHYIGVQPNINHSKRFVNATKQSNGSWNVEYAIAVVNSGGASGQYTLTDQPTFDNDITINSALYSSNVPSSGALVGTGPWTLGTNVSLAAGASHVYMLLVNVNMNLQGGGGNDLYTACNPQTMGQPNQALFNRSTLQRPGQPNATADACGNLPAIEITKYTNGEDADSPPGPAILVGSQVVWTYRITNTGGINLQNLTLFDDQLGGITCPVTSLAVGASTLCTKNGTATPGQYANTAIVTGTTPSGVITPTVTVTDSNPSHYFGSSPESASLGDFVWHDLNADGVQGNGEPGIPAVTVNLLAGDCTTSLNQTTSTNSSGIYTFTNLAPGSYCVQFVLPPDFDYTTKDVGDDATDSDAGADGKSSAITLAAGESNLTVDAGLVQRRLTLDVEPLCILDAPYISYTVSANFPTQPNPVTIRWLDVDDNSVLSQTTGLPLVNQLLWPGAGIDPVTKAGNQWPGWSFDEVNHVWVDNGSPLRPQVKVEITVNPTEVVTVDYPPANPTCNAAPPTVASVGDFVWHDVNKNSLQDPGEPGIPNVEVRLYGTTITGTVTSAAVSANEQLVMTTTTNAEGLYQFDNLQPGAYYLEFGPLRGYGSARFDANGNSQDALDSDPQLPYIAVSISDGGIISELGKPVTYTVFFTNTDATLNASALALSMTIPTGTTFLPASSDSNWQCSGVAAGQVCNLTIPALAAGATRSLTFTVLLGEDDAEVPNLIDLFADVTNGTPARTATVILDPGEVDLTIDAGFELLHAQTRTPTPSGPTNLPAEEQPGRGRSLFLPSLQRQE